MQNIFKKFIKKNIKNAMLLDAFKDLDNNEFYDILINFAYKEMSKKTKNESNTIRVNKIFNLKKKYSDEIKRYMLKDPEFKGI